MPESAAPTADSLAGAFNLVAHEGPTAPAEPAQRKPPPPLKPKARDAKKRRNSRPPKGSPSKPPPAKGPSSPAPATRASPSSPPLPADRTEFQKMLADIEDGFEAILTPGDEFLAHAPTEHESMQEVTTLFDAIAAHYVGPVRQLVVELRLGDPPREWLDVIVPAMTSLKRSAQGMGMADLVTASDQFLTALEIAGASGEPMIRDPSKDLIVEAYAELAKALPEAFAIDEDRSQRDTVILQTLLSQVPGVGKVALDKIYEAGLTSLDMFMTARPQDVSDATGIAPELARGIVERIARYRRETATMVPELPTGPDGASSKRSRGLLYDKKLTELVTELEKRHVAFEEATSAWTPEAVRRRRSLRADRQAALLEVHLLLARLGEIDLLRELEKISFERKIQVLWKKLEDGKA